MSEIIFPEGTDEARAVQRLGQFYWPNSVLSKLRLSTFNDFLQYLSRKSPGTFKSLGASLKTVKLSTVEKVFKAIAAKSGTSYPSPYDFGMELAKEVGKVGVSEIGDAVKESALEIGSLSLSGLKIVFVVAVLVGGVILYQKAGGEFGWKHA